MQLICDLHIHGRFSRGTSKNLSVFNLEKFAKIKGINVLGIGDFTHPQWINEVKQNLTDNGEGILFSKTNFPFVCQTEISLIYSQDNKGHRIHNLVFAPNLEVVQQITEWLKTFGRIDYDGRPIFNISCPEFIEGLKSISSEIEVIPAHAWTPWFSLFGSKSGFDSLKECFQDKTKYIHAIETGLSSDPAMNWRLSQLDEINLVSFSDAHSFWFHRIGREATVFDIKLTYKNLIKAIRTGNGLIKTIEVDPRYGKYHADGHKACNFCSNPKKTIELNGLCPKCGKPLVIGVDYRVEELADRPKGFKPKNAKPFQTLLPLTEIISLVIGKQVTTKSVLKIYNDLIKETNEFHVLLEMSEQEIMKRTNNNDLMQAIMKNRKGLIDVFPGYDGIYGIPKI